ncbi:glutathione S-transferase family protein [Octadecabacter sp. 1_MG-2023]|uniref:glutathione S-transferase family protein n=1 Tax=unclassified Octadecabacter TaxID=196158 RepID=UPI001C0960E0|nr:MULTISPECIES: glutathione S-transferase family protein [unclassified Octadecabacter]MBU2993561.1 glutathione S-transferase family protein [Octadecabacter sp. B2R22]MDO6735595.1 glutathione S-transferase family protein [Octadecabacter sp. 1_MG-2023]
MLTLFAAKGTVAVASQIALEEAELPYNTRWISFADGDQHAAPFRELNPKGRVPALITDFGPLTETPAILEYISDLSGKLMPDTPIERARVREMLSYLASTMHVNHAHKFRGARWSDDPAAHATMVVKVPETMAESCAYLESQLPDIGWLLGEYSIADIHMVSVCRWLAADNVDINTFPKLAAHFTAMKSRPAVAKIFKAHE